MNDSRNIIHRECQILIIPPHWHLNSLLHDLSSPVPPDCLSKAPSKPISPSSRIKVYLDRPKSSLNSSRLLKVFFCSQLKIFSRYVSIFRARSGRSISFTCESYGRFGNRTFCDDVVLFIRDRDRHTRALRIVRPIRLANWKFLPVRLHALPGPSSFVSSAVPFFSSLVETERYIWIGFSGVKWTLSVPVKSSGPGIDCPRSFGFSVAGSIVRDLWTGAWARARSGLSKLTDWRYFAPSSFSFFLSSLCCFHLARNWVAILPWRTNNLPHLHSISRSISPLHDFEHVLEHLDLISRRFGELRKIN